MNPLQAQLDRLYLIAAAAPAAAHLSPGDRLVVGADGRVRAMVLSLGAPAEWDLAAGVWQGVQAELGLSAPAIAVSGTNAYQLWFSLAVPVAASTAHAFLQGLCRRFLAGVKPQRIDCFPADASTAAEALPQAPLLPAAQTQSGRWCAFVTSDLAALFADDACLDTEPSAEAQAAVLARLQSMPAAAFEAALQRLGIAAVPDAPQALATAVTPESAGALTAAPADKVLRAPFQSDPHHFLMVVMNDASQPMALRIEAAKALLAYPAHAQTNRPG